MKSGSNTRSRFTVVFHDLATAKGHFTVAAVVVVLPDAIAHITKD